MKEYKITMYAPDQNKFWFNVTASSRAEAEIIALKRMIVIGVEEVEHEQFTKMGL